MPNIELNNYEDICFNFNLMSDLYRNRQGFTKTYLENCPQINLLSPVSLAFLIWSIEINFTMYHSFPDVGEILRKFGITSYQISRNEIGQAANITSITTMDGTVINDPQTGIQPLIERQDLLEVANYQSNFENLFRVLPPTQSHPILLLSPHSDLIKNKIRDLSTSNAEFSRSLRGATHAKILDIIKNKETLQTTLQTALQRERRTLRVAVIRNAIANLLREHDRTNLVIYVNPDFNHFVSRQLLHDALGNPTQNRSINDFRITSLANDVWRLNSRTREFYIRFSSIEPFVANESLISSSSVVSSNDLIAFDIDVSLYMQFKFKLLVDNVVQFYD